MYLVKYEKQAAKFLKKLVIKADVKRIINKVEELAINPFPKDTKRVEGYRDPKVFRIRVGTYRVLYFVDYANLKLYIIKIDKRERVY